ncbi:hypothetical protein NMY22_g8552 [Coprinellus aureogranulatus]|nr:hypothetical protein NMY22_g8552 [Coprinellus aureogranulatus]
MSSQTANILETLPTDVLNLIIEDVRRCHFRTLCDLRLVCKQFNTLVEPLAFSAVTFLPHKRMTDFQSQLKRLASGRSPNSRWTKQLRIGPSSLVPLASPGLGHGWGSKEAADSELRRLSALVTQKKKLVRAIEALKHVTYASYHAHDKEPYEAVLGALARLPKLEHISITFSSDFEGRPLPLASFSNLRVIELVRPCFFPSVVAAIQGMLTASSRTLECITIAPIDWSREFGWGEPSSDTNFVRTIGLDVLVEGSADEASRNKRETVFARLSNHLLSQRSSLPETVSLYPPLKKVVINASRIGLSGMVVSRLPSLVHLDAMNASSGCIDDSFWKALAEQRIRLEYLAIWPLTSAIVEYLLSYSGLKTLSLGAKSSRTSEIKNTEEERLFSVVLPRHRRTLENLWLDGPQERGHGAVTEERLENIARCNELQSLWICHPALSGEQGAGTSKHRPVDMGLLLSRLAQSLPRLHLLRISLVEPARHWPYFRCGKMLQMESEASVLNLVQAVALADLAGQTPNFSIGIRGMGGGEKMMHFDLQQRTFVEEKASLYRGMRRPVED